MNCQSCGAKLKNGAKFCANCGVTVTDAAPARSVSRFVPAPVPNKKVCSLCGGKIGLSKAKTTDGHFVCSDCLSVARQNVTLQQAAQMSLADYRQTLEDIDASQRLLPAFHPTAAVEPFLRVDEQNRKWYAVPKKNGVPIVHSYDEVVEYELLEDGNTVTKGGLGRAAAGAVLFGGFGAVVGASTGRKKSKATVSRLELKITLNRMASPVVYIQFITGGDLQKDGMIYKNLEQSAQKCLSFFQIMTQGSQQPEPAPQPQISVADEILRFKELLDMGVITQEEFDAKKKQLLGL